MKNEEFTTADMVWRAVSNFAGGQPEFTCKRLFTHSFSIPVFHSTQKGTEKRLSRLYQGRQKEGEKEGSRRDAVVIKSKKHNCVRDFR